MHNYGKEEKSEKPKRDKDKINKNIQSSMKKKCIPDNCPYIPICESGCLYMKEIQKISYDKPYCRKKYFNKLILEYIKFKLIK